MKATLFTFVKFNTFSWLYQHFSSSFHLKKHILGEKYLAMIQQYRICSKMQRCFLSDTLSQVFALKTCFWLCSIYFLCFKMEQLIMERTTQRLNISVILKAITWKIYILSAMTALRNENLSHTIGFSVLRISNILFDWLWLNWLFSPCWTTCPLGKTAWEIVSEAFGTHSFFHPDFQHSLRIIHLATRHFLGRWLFHTKHWSPLHLLKPLQSGTPVAYCKNNCFTNHFHSFNPWAFSFQYQTKVRMFVSIL